MDAIFGREEPCGSEFLQREKKKKEKEEVYNAVNEVPRKEKLKEKSVDYSDLCAVRAIMDAAKVPLKDEENS